MTTGVLTPEQLAEVCWGLLNQGVQQRKITVPSGETVEVEAEQYVRLLQWAATLKIKKPKAVSKPEDYQPRQTRQR